jgi:ankyrin repeat protein
MVRDEPASVQWRIGDGRYDVPTKDPAGVKGGNIYIWRLGGHLSPIEVAAHLEKYDLIDILLPLASSRDQLAVAIRRGDRARAQAVLEKEPALFENAKPPLESLLGDMAWQGKTDSVATLLDCGADVDTRWHFGHTPLIIATLCGYPELVRLLLERGADVEAKNEFGGTAVCESAFGSLTTPEFSTNPDGDYLACAKLLVEAGASLAFDFEIGQAEVLAYLAAARTA